MAKAKNIIPAQEKSIISGLFKGSDISSSSYVDYKFIEKKKIVVFLPEENAEAVSLAMAKAGAGKIGEYDNCSFRIQGTGTFKPSSAAKPYSGKKSRINYVEEIRLEMECKEKDLDNVIDAMLSNHPYEEPAYEIYSFTRRTNIVNGIIINFKKPVSIRSIIKKINKGIDTQEGTDVKITRLGIVSKAPGEMLVEKFKNRKAGYLLYRKNKNYIINKL